MSFLSDIRYAARALAGARGLAFTVIVTLALGIGGLTWSTLRRDGTKWLGCNTDVTGFLAAIEPVLADEALRLANEDEDRLVYIRQTARGIGAENANFSIPELRDFQSGIRSIGAFGDFSTIEFTMVGIGEPRVVRAGVVGHRAVHRVPQDVGRGRARRPRHRP